MISFLIVSAKIAVSCINNLLHTYFLEIFTDDIFHNVDNLIPTRYHVAQFVYSSLKLAKASEYGTSLIAVCRERGRSKYNQTKSN